MNKIKNFLPGMVRYNKNPLLIVGGIFLVFALVIFYVGVNRGKKKPEAERDHGVDASSVKDDIAPDAKGGLITAQKPKPIAPTLPTSEGKNEGAAGPKTGVVVSKDPELEAIRKQRIAAYKAALEAPPSIKNRSELKQTAKEMEEALPSADPDQLVEESPRESEMQASASGGNALGQFDGRKSRWNLNTRLEAPATKYILRTGFVVPAILMSAMNSDLPGTIIAQVAQDVYDTPTGEHLLIPQGSRIVGTYASAIEYGQERVFAAWQRIIYPDGSALDIGAMPGADADGEAGFNDKVDTHMARFWTNAVLLSAITAGITWSQNQWGGYSSFGQPISAGQVLSQATGQILGMSIAKLLEKNLDVSPTIKIRPGYRFNIMVVKDLLFEKPYRVPIYSRN